MDIAQLKYFVTLCEEKNYTKAAEKCFLSRQALRQAVVSMEKNYGMELIHNEKNHLSVTPVGRILCQNARLVIAAYEEMEQAVYASVVIREPLRVGISRSLVPLYAPEVVHELDVFGNRYPGIKMEKEMLSSDSLIKKLYRRELDCGILIDCDEPAYDLHRKVLQEFEMTVFLSAVHPLAEKGEVKLEDLDRVHLQVMSRPDICLYSFLQECNRRGVHPYFDVVSDYYEVGYNVLNKGYLAIDRYDDAPRSSTALDRSLPLEGGKYKLCTSLVWGDSSHIGVRMMDAFLPDLQRGGIVRDKK